MQAINRNDLNVCYGFDGREIEGAKVKHEKEVDEMADRAANAIGGDPNAEWYSKEYLRGVKDALDWVTEFTDDAPVADPETRK